uniref:HAT C-terminal dimerisation domain-containing protein n=1 Tax=Labrus bergylta TaxID=56723 RepID=A0A3Q3GZU0_9LABR
WTKGKITFKDLIYFLVFQPRWETDYLFTEFKGKPLCLVCLETKSAMKDFNLSRHYNTTHKDKYDKQRSCKSRYRLTRRIFDIQNHVEVKLKEVMHDCKYFSLALDESMDVRMLASFIYARAIDSSFEGRDIFNAVQSVVSEYGGFDKLSAVVTDGAPSMQGKHTGFAGLLQQSGVDCPILHCIIHQNVGILCENFYHSYQSHSRRNRSLNHKTFVAFLDEVSAVYGDLQMHTEVRWMSRGKRLERFFALLAEIPVFLEDSIRCDTSAYCSKLRDTEFLFDMAFLADITSHLNHLNMQLQEEKTFHLTSKFGTLRSFEQMCKDPRMPENTSQVQIEKLQQQFKNRFQDFYTMKPRIVLFTDPLSAAVSAQPPELQLQLCELQSDPFFQAKRQERGISFWRLLPESRFPLLRDFALSMAGIFGSTYICESNFSTMKHIKSKERNRLTDETLFHLMQIGCTNIDIQSIVRQQERPQISH